LATWWWWSAWTAVPWSPTRTSNVQFTLTDVSNAWLYDLLLSRCTILKRTESSVIKQAIVETASYWSNVVTVNMIWDTMASIDSNSLKYFITKANTYCFQYPWTIGVFNDIGSSFYPKNSIKIFGYDAHHIIAWTTGNTTYTISKNSRSWSGTIGTGVSIASWGYHWDWQTATSGTSSVIGDYLVINCTAVSTTAPVWVVVNLYYTDLYNVYLT
jgi:hypothetical protein